MKVEVSRRRITRRRDRRPQRAAATSRAWRTPSGKVITAEVPLAEMFGYATSVRSMSRPSDLHDGVRQYLSANNVRGVLKKPAEAAPFTITDHQSTVFSSRSC